AVAGAVRETLPPEQAARYQKELDQRATARKHAILLNLIGMLDNALFLTTEQREQLFEILKNNWQDSWNQSQWFTLAGQYYPPMPDAKIVPILTEPQKDIWRGLSKGNIRFG